MLSGRVRVTAVDPVKPLMKNGPMNLRERFKD